MQIKKNLLFTIAEKSASMTDTVLEYENRALPPSHHRQPVNKKRRPQRAFVHASGSWISSTPKPRQNLTIRGEAENEMPQLPSG